MKINYLIGMLVIPLLIGCGPKHMLNVDYSELSESPCVDGTIFNIDHAGCEVFYWGRSGEAQMVKLRCTYSPDSNFWTETSFYVTAPVMTTSSPTWILFCADLHTFVYAETAHAK